MPRKKKPKEGDEGACPRCRKLIPLVDDRGSFVLRTHHVVISDLGYRVKECDGSRGEPAALDDSQDWGWVPEEVAREASEPTPLGEAIRTVTGQIRATSEASLSMGEAIGRLRETIADFPVITDEGSFTADGGPRIADMMRMSSVPQSLMPSRVEVNGVDLTGAISSVEIHIEPSDVQPVNFTATVLTALRQAWIDETGAPPSDATVRLSEPEFTSGMQVLDIVFEPYGLRVSIPIHSEVPELPGAAEAAGREAAATVRRALRERMETRCTAVDDGHECDQPRGQHDHCCRFCHWRWRDPVTPSLTPDPDGYTFGV